MKWNSEKELKLQFEMQREQQAAQLEFQRQQLEAERQQQAAQLEMQRQQQAAGLKSVCKNSALRTKCASAEKKAIACVPEMSKPLSVKTPSLLKQKDMVIS